MKYTSKYAKRLKQNPVLNQVQKQEHGKILNQLLEQVLRHVYVVQYANIKCGDSIQTSMAFNTMRTNTADKILDQVF